jgi:hypothetical protein
LQYLNIASIRNQGWELHGSLQLGPITTRGTYSWTKSRTIGVTEKYRSVLPKYSFYEPGATFSYLPEHTFAGGVTYARSGTTVGININGIGRARNDQNTFVLTHLSRAAIRLSQNVANMVSQSAYVSFNNMYATADASVNHRFSSAIEGVLQMQNLTNRYVNDSNGAYATIGRQVKVGARVRAR